MPQKFTRSSRSVLSVLGLVLFACALWFGWQAYRVQPVSEGCLPLGDHHLVCAASDMARPARRGAVPLEDASFDLRGGAVRLEAARNETVAFQLIVRTVTAGAARLQLELAPFVAPAAAAADAGATMRQIDQQWFQAHYVALENAGYTWGPPTEVLPWPAAYPDALIPATQPCTPARPLSESAVLAAEAGANQAVWIDTYVGSDTPVGLHTQRIRLQIGAQQLEVPVQLRVHAARLPDKPSFEAVGEIYGAYGLEGVGHDLTEPGWQAMAQCYQQLAHRHRTVFIERFPKGLQASQQDAYVQTFGPALTGELFTAAHGYRGPGAGQPLTVWRPPWPQRVDVTLDAPLAPAELDHYQTLAARWQSLVQRERWQHTRYFAYVFDEVDGPPAEGVDAGSHRRYVAMTHAEMARLQQTLDAGAPEVPLDLLWTSHSNPAQWQGDPALDLTGKIRFWAPNASAADPAFLAERVQAGDTAWIYHSGHPSIGAHSINASGIEMWAVNLGSDTRPFDEPVFRPEEDRAGNGVLVYPGNALPQLPLLGLPATPGPIPSMRLKAWRRGLQDAELYLLAHEQDAAGADKLIRAIMPRALADGQGAAAWPDDPAQWLQFHRDLLRLASQGTQS